MEWKLLEERFMNCREFELHIREQIVHFGYAGY